MRCGPVSETLKPEQAVGVWVPALWLELREQTLEAGLAVIVQSTR